MPSLNLDLNYFDHVKTIRLVARLGPGADVLPIRLWAWVGNHQPHTGRLALLEAEIEHICHWWGERGAMVASMTEIGFLKKVDDIYHINDWLEHSGHLASYHKRAKKAARIRWGIERKTSNASSNATSISKQSPSSAVQYSTVQGIKDTPCDPPISAVPYKVPDKATDPAGNLVIAYKLFKGFEKEDRTWDKTHFARTKKSTVDLLAICGSYDGAFNCLGDIASEMDKKSLTWTIETIVKHAHEWKLKRGQNAESESSGGVFVAGQPVVRIAAEGPRGGGLMPAGKILTGLRGLPDPER